MACPTHRVAQSKYAVPSEHSNAFTPTLYSWIQIYVERKWICLAGGNWGYVIFVSIDKRDNLHCCLLQRRSHGLHHLGSLC